MELKDAYILHIFIKEIAPIVGVDSFGKIVFSTQATEDQKQKATEALRTLSQEDYVRLKQKYDSRPSFPVLVNALYDSIQIPASSKAEEVKAKRVTEEDLKDIVSNVIVEPKP